MVARAEDQDEVQGEAGEKGRLTDTLAERGY